jgi:hypothetical protein
MADLGWLKQGTGKNSFEALSPRYCNIAFYLFCLFFVFFFFAVSVRIKISFLYLI